MVFFFIMLVMARVYIKRMDVPLWTGLVLMGLFAGIDLYHLHPELFSIRIMGVFLIPATIYAAVRLLTTTSTNAEIQGGEKGGKGNDGSTRLDKEQ
jgi:hypothetical protein